MPHQPRIPSIMEVTKEFIINKGNTNSNSQNGEQNSEPVNYEWPPTSSPNPIYLCVIA